MTIACVLILLRTIATAIPASSEKRPFNAGFDCLHAKTKVENTICSVKELADADLKMSSIYREILSYLPADGQHRLKHKQIAWLTVRDKCGSSNNIISCLRDCYLSRIKDLIREGALEFPSVISKEEKSNPSFKVNSNIPFEALPRATQVYTNNLIANRFIANPEGLADRFYGVTLENYKENVDFFLSFNPLGRNHEFRELWFYYLGVAQKGGGKAFPITTLIISKEGTVLYGDGNEISVYWSIGEVKRTKAGITIDIVNYRDGELHGRYLYDQKYKRLTMLCRGVVGDKDVQEAKVEDSLLWELFLKSSDKYYYAPATLKAVGETKFRVWTREEGEPQTWGAKTGGFDRLVEVDCQSKTFRHIEAYAVDDGHRRDTINLVGSYIIWNHGEIDADSPMYPLAKLRCLGEKVDLNIKAIGQCDTSTDRFLDIDDAER